MKIITLCGSLKFQKEMMIVAEKMALEGNCILTPVYPIIENLKISEEQLRKLKETHFKRIELSDAILVINVNNYVGNSTSLEIQYAKELGKEIIYYTDLATKKNYVKLHNFDKNRIICYNKKHNLRVYLGLPNLSDKEQLK